MALKKNQKYSQPKLDNHSNELNPNNNAYWTSRGFDERPEDWEDRVEDDKEKESNS